MSPRKKKRKYSSDNVASFSSVNYFNSEEAANTPQKSCNTKTANIIDRVLDLSKYNAETGMYTLTRDWMNANTIVNDKSKRTSLNSNEQMNTDDETESNSITKLPDPDATQTCITIDQLNEEIGNEIRSGQANDMELIKSLNLDEFMETHALLKLHVDRWKSCRRKWITYYEQTNKPYKNSNDLLKSIYEEMQ
jgi:hypothetical protein